MPFLSQLMIGVLDNHGLNYSSKTFSTTEAKVWDGSILKEPKEFSVLKQKIIQHDLRITHLPFLDIC